MSLVSEIIDPNFPVEPFIVGDRLLPTDIWRVSGQHWDDELQKNSLQKFIKWSLKLPKLAKVPISRIYPGIDFLRSVIQKFYSIPSRESSDTCNFASFATVLKRFPVLLRCSEIMQLLRMGLKRSLQLSRVKPA